MVNCIVTVYMCVQVKTLGYDRYKIVVEVVIGEQRGEGVRYLKMYNFSQIFETNYFH